LCRRRRGIWGVGVVAVVVAAAVAAVVSVVNDKVDDDVDMTKNSIECYEPIQPEKSIFPTVSHSLNSRDNFVPSRVSLSECWKWW